MNQEAFFISDEQMAGLAVRLSKTISAIQLQLKEDGSAKLGLLSQLGAGTRVTVCGEGFNDRTVKVRANDSWFYVFAQDLEAEAAPNNSFVASA